MRRILELFFQSKSVANPWTVVGCILLGSIAEGIGIASLLPLVALASNEDPSSAPVIGRVAADFFAALGMKPSLGPLLCVFIVAAALKAGLTLLAIRYVGQASAAVTTRLRSDIIERLLRVRWAFFQRHPLGGIASAMSGEATRAGTAYVLAATFIASVAQSIIYLAIALVVSWRLTLLAMVFGALIALSLGGFVGSAKRAGRRQSRRMRAIVVILIDAINNIKPLKAMAKQDRFARFLESRIQDLRSALRKEVWVTEARRRIEEFLTALFLAGAFYVAVAILHYDIGKVIVMGVLLARTMANVGKIQAAYQRAVVIESAFFSIQDLIREATEEQERLGQGVAPTLDVSIRLENVSFAYDATPVLTDVTLEIPVGRISVFTGPSGSGKTTLTDLVIGLSQPISGRVLIDGAPIETLDAGAWRSMIGYVPQEIVLLHDTLRTNVTLGDERLTDADARAALASAGAADFVDALPEGLDTLVGEKGGRLSGGQRQRIALARALATRPKLLILDEVTSALDPESEAAIVRTIAELPRGMAVIAITHRPAFLDVADVLYRVEGGRVRRLDPGNGAAGAS